MKVVIALILSLFSLIDLRAMNPVKDKQIISALSSEKFTNILIHYKFGNEAYPIRIIYNPNQEILWGDCVTQPVPISLIMIANVPIPLERYIEFWSKSRAIKSSFQWTCQSVVTELVSVFSWRICPPSCKDRKS